MIESHVFSVIRKYTQGGNMLTLGDHIPSSGLGFSSLNELSGLISNKPILDI